MFFCNGNLYDIWDHSDFLIKVLDITKDAVFDQKNIWEMKIDLIKSGFRFKKSFFIHKCIDACKLETDRSEGCALMVATKDGPLSVCMHNAKSDKYILAPVTMKHAKGRVKNFFKKTGLKVVINAKK